MNYCWGHGPSFKTKAKICPYCKSPTFNDDIVCIICSQRLNLCGYCGTTVGFDKQKVINDLTFLSRIAKSKSKEYQKLILDVKTEKISDLKDLRSRLNFIMIGRYLDWH